jgi:hypothetical protein
MRALEHLFASMPRTDERYPERPAALAASDTPDGPN